MIAGSQEYAHRNRAPGEGRDARPGTGQVRVMLAGGSRLLQDSVVSLLDSERFSVGASVSGMGEAIRVLQEKQDAFDLVIVQLLGFSDIHFFDDLIRLRELSGHSRLVLLAWGEKDMSFLAGCVEAGADAYLDGNLSQRGLCRALEGVIAGRQVFSSSASADSPWKTVEEYEESDTGLLSRREIEILRHLANGEPNKVIAKALGITEATVKVHVKGILRKTGARNRTSAAIWAIQNGLKPALRKG